MPWYRGRGRPGTVVAEPGVSLGVRTDTLTASSCWGFCVEFTCLCLTRSSRSHAAVTA